MSEADCHSNLGSKRSGTVGGASEESGENDRDHAGIGAFDLIPCALFATDPSVWEATAWLGRHDPIT
jgi:hypothetical protein